jgi:pilus assembly protein CpaB
VSVRSVLVVLLALVCGGSAAIFVNTWRNSLTTPAAPPETVPVVVAAVDVERFTALTPDMLKTRDFPKDLAPPGAAAHIEDVIDRNTQMNLVKDEAVTENKLTPRGAGRGMAPSLPEGMGAFTIQTPNIAVGVAGFILPGNKVDVLLTTSGIGPKEVDGGASTMTLLHSIEVLAVDQQVDAPNSNKVDVNKMRSVTLLVTPKQARKLDLGQSKGTLHLLLRNGKDVDSAQEPPETLHDIGFPEPPKVVKAGPEPLPPPTPAMPEPPPIIRTVRGTQGGFVVVN